MGESNIYLLLISIKIWQLETLQFTRQKTYLLFSCRGPVIGKDPGGTMIWESCLSRILSAVVPLSC